MLVTPDDPEALVAAIRGLLDDPAARERLGAAGRERVMQRFTWQVTARGTAACYDAILTGAPAARGRGVRLMLTCDYDRLGLVRGDLLLDLGCGFGRHAYEAARRGADVIALDAGGDEVPRRGGDVRRDGGGRRARRTSRPAWAPSRATPCASPSPTRRSTG